MNSSEARELTRVFCGARVMEFLVFYVVFYKSLFFFMSLFFNLRPLITPLVSSNLAMALIMATKNAHTEVSSPFI
jgi:hypothetical protein